MPLPVTLNTNEVKNSAGTEQEFSRLGGNDRQLEFGLTAETPSSPHRLKVSHMETGTGVKARRRSLVRVDKTVAGANTDPVTVSAYVVVDIPIGNLSTYDEPKNVLANLLSFCASTGADTAIKFDCTGNGASALIAGSL